MRRCYLVRHAQTAWNFENRLQGHTDLSLDPTGRAQAERLGHAFAHHQIASLTTSRLARSQETARAILAGNGHQVQVAVEPGLEEMHLGAWEGLTPREIDARYNRAYTHWARRSASIDIPGAETHAAFRARVRGAAARVLARCGDGEHIVVSHGGVIAALLADWLDADYDALLRRLRLDNASITALDVSGDVPHVLWVNTDEHLA